jgi:site-specific DNA recombinase
MSQTNVLIYVRVSTDEQANQGYSLEHQESALNAFCKVKKYKVLHTYKEDYSAKSFDRPEWSKLMAFIKANKGLVNRIVFLKWDRFSRNQFDALEMIRRLNKLNVGLECVEQNFDFEDPDALLMLSIHTAIPEIENKKISQRTKDGMRKASENGCWVGKPPFGYTRDWIQIDTQRKNATLKPNEDAGLVRKIFHYFVDEYLSADKIRARVLAENGRRFSKQGILYILTNRCYIGEVHIMAYKDKPEQIVKGFHKAIIPFELFNAAQVLLKTKRRKHHRKDKSEQFPLKGIVRCSVCGLSYTASITTKNRGLNKYPYYHCSKTKGHDRFPAQDVHHYFNIMLKEFKLKDEVLSLYEKVLVEAINENNVEIIQQKNMLERELEVVKTRIRNTEDKIADNPDDSQMFIDMYRRFQEEESVLVMKHASMKAEATPKRSDISYLLQLFNSFDLVYNYSDYKLKKLLLSSIFPNPLEFHKNHFRTKQVSPLLELLVLNSKQLQLLKIETSHFSGDSSTKAPPAGLEPATL